MNSIILTQHQVIELQNIVTSFFCGLEDYILNDERITSVTFNSDFSCTYSLTDGSASIGFGLSWYGLSFDDLVYFSQKF